MIVKVKIGAVTLSHIEHAKMEELIAKAKGGERRLTILFLTMGGFVKAVFSASERQKLDGVDLIYPTSSLLRWGFDRIGQTELRSEFINAFSFTVALLNTLERQGDSLFILGGSNALLGKVEKNIRQSFPSLRIVGRYSGKMKRGKMEDILLTIKKSDPTLLLLGKKNTASQMLDETGEIAGGITLLYPSLFNIISGRRGQSPRKRDPLLIFLYHITRPWRLYRLFFSIFFLIYLNFCRLLPNNGRITEPDDNV